MLTAEVGNVFLPDMLVQTQSSNGNVEKDIDGKLAMTVVTLKPKIVFDGKTIPSREQVDELHHLAHEKCFIANSVKTEVNIVQI